MNQNELILARLRHEPQGASPRFRSPWLVKKPWPLFIAPTGEPAASAVPLTYVVFPRYTKYKPSGVEWLGDVPEHWVRTSEPQGASRGFRSPWLVKKPWPLFIATAGEPAASAVPLTQVTP